MFDISFLKSSPHFTTKKLVANEVLFDEWDSDHNIYIVIDWLLNVEKYTTSQRKETKVLATLESENFIGEWGLSWIFTKEVKILAKKETTLLLIDAQKWFSTFMEETPEQAKDFLSTIISITNRRLNDANKYITSMYQINKDIRELEDVNFREIFKILDRVNSIMESEFLLFLEVNPVMKEYITLKYDSRNQWKMADVIVEKWNYNLEEIGVDWDYKILTKEITLWKESLWNIIVWRKTSFSENEKRIFLALVSSLSWVLKQKKTLEEDRDREFSKG